MNQVLPDSFNFKTPEIYQLELSSVCNFACPNCSFRSAKRKEKFLDLDLMKTILERDTENSYFLEFQFTGEPTAHPHFNEAIKLAREVVKFPIGMSTNGSKIIQCMDGITKLDYMTISIDSTDEALYGDFRKGGNFSELIAAIQELMAHKIRPYIDFQFIEYADADWINEIEKFKILAAKKQWLRFLIRTVPDCFITLRTGQDCGRNELCLNPFTSCSIHSDGDVVPCCFDAHKNIALGNLKDESLAEVWNADPIKELRRQHLSNELNPLCSKCYMKSPFLLHLSFIKEWVRHEGFLCSNRTV